MNDRNSSLSRNSLTARVDRLVGQATAKLASGIPRRSFLSRLSTGIVAVGTTGLILKPSEAQAGFCSITECRGTDEIGVCYTPWKVTAPGGIGVYKGPSFSAERVRDTGGNPIVIPVNAHFGRVSNRYSSSCGDPGPRPSYNGFIWGYWCTGTGRQGWIPYGAGYSEGDSGWSGSCCGPAGKDWDCTDPKSSCPEYVGCGGVGAGSGTCSQAYWTIGTSGSDMSHERYYIRYGADSTTFGWLVPGDRVKRWGYKSAACCVACPSGMWSCVQAICCAYVPNGCRGWVCSDVLGSPTSNNSPCYPGLPCPN